MTLEKQTSAYLTNWGAAYCGDSLKLLAELPDDSVSLFLTSPPFALQREKEYGNKAQDEYVAWLAQFGRLARQKLKEDGSLVIDLGGAYEAGSPTRSLYNFRVALHLCDEIGFYLAEDFYWFNPSKLPSPIEWVNKRKLRAKDSVNTVWWFGKSRWPKADVSKVLTAYSDRMKKLLEDPASYYSPKKRPSGHDIGTTFAKDNGGAIPSNLLQIPNSESNSAYLRGCKAMGIKGHPARFPAKLPEFFIRMLTDPHDLVVDFFAGSNTTGYVAESERRRWLAFEQRLDYLAASGFRFCADNASDTELRSVYDAILQGKVLDLRHNIQQARHKDVSQGTPYPSVSNIQGDLMLAETSTETILTSRPILAQTQYKLRSKNFRKTNGKRPGKKALTPSVTPTF